jgi:hypothetical protein
MPREAWYAIASYDVRLPAVDRLTARAARVEAITSLYSMNLRKLTRAPLGLLALTAFLALLAASTDANAAAPLSPSGFDLSPLCSAPAPEHSGCLGLQLAPQDPLAQPGTRAVPEQSSELPAEAESEAAAEGIPPGEAAERKTPYPHSLSPANLLSAYGLAGVSPPSAQTIALVDAYDDATIASDLETFDSHFGLSPCNEANGCLRKVNQSGASAPLPASSGETERGWAVEIATDVEVAHGVCQSCEILLVEANSNENKDLYTAEQTAAALGANEISNSWGGEEPLVDNQAFNHPGIVITASAGDDGYLDWFSGELSEAAEYPASSPHVVAVGGTSLKLNSETGAREGETVWNDGGRSNGKVEPLGAGGGGCSASFLAPGWQQSVAGWAAVGCEDKRAVADVSADADPNTGVAVYDSTEYKQRRGWAMIGGTSVASPTIAASFALAGGAHGVAYPARTLYENLASDPIALHDIASGSNGECLAPVRVNGEAKCSAEEEAQTCAQQAICLAGGGYDGPTGVGTPASINAFLPITEHTSEGAISSSPSSSASPQSATGTSTPGTSAPRTMEPAGAPATSDPSVLPVISALKLTRNALAALARRHAPLYKLGFSFRLSAATRVRVTLQERVSVHGHVSWRTISASLSFLASGGVQSRSLSGRAVLASGSYRLTLTPAHGSAKSLSFTIH